MTRLRMTGRNRLALGLLLLAGAGAGSAWLLRSAIRHQTQTHDPIAEVRRIFDAAPSVVLFEPGHARAVPDVVESVATLLNAARDRREWFSDERRREAARARPTPEQRRLLSRLIAEWLCLRSRADPREYSAWARGRGYSLRRDDPAEDGFDESYEHFTKQPYSPAVNREELFSAIFAGTLGANNGVIRPVEVGDVEVYFGYSKAQRGGDIEGDLLPDNPPDRWWVGMGVFGSRRHWLPPVTLSDVVKRDGRALCAAVNMAVLGASGSWIIHRVYCYYDPRSNSWHIEGAAGMSLKDSTVGTGFEI